MNKKDINNSFKELLRTSGIFDTDKIVYPKVPNDPGYPHAKIIFGNGERPNVALKGGAIRRELGLLTINVCVELNSDGGEDTVNDLAESVAGLFYAGRRMTITGGTVTIRKPPSIRAGIPTDKDWYVPVIINYVANDT